MTPLLPTGHEKDTNTNLIYFKARFYDPDTGRFLNQDPYLGEAGTPPSLHRYLYAYANPTVYVDLDGYKVYKSVGDDGEVTYSDTPPAPTPSPRSGSNETVVTEEQVTPQQQAQNDIDNYRSKYGGSTSKPITDKEISNIIDAITKESSDGPVNDVVPKKQKDFVADARRIANERNQQTKEALSKISKVSGYSQAALEAFVPGGSISTILTMIEEGKFNAVQLLLSRLKVKTKNKLPKGVTLKDPSKIRFSQDSIKREFQDTKFGSIDDLVAKLKNKKKYPGFAESMKPIRLVSVNGKLVSIDNRRLAAYRKAGMKVIPTRTATKSEIKQALKMNKFGKNKFSAGMEGGSSIKVRGSKEIIK